MTSLTYRFELIFAIPKQIIFISLNLLLWKTLYSDKAAVSDVTYEQMLTFTILIAFLNNVYVHSIEGTLRGRIRMGNVAVDYIKPINVFAMYLADDLGLIVVNLVQRFLPLLLIYSIFIKSLMPASIINFILFLVSVALGFLIIWLLSAIFGLLYFWVIDLGLLGEIRDYIVNFLSGSRISK
ncbi:ABC-2 family transporter protein [Clostridium thermosuccinogenes]|uniref:ABC-2 family transporter protein n=1 Tax=Clostridium thermosuccinogenes TaxID=84032 RepID=UPI001374C0EA|nr:ABC-2 family transporter protein [Pseudoclostridium thermosuccinogenes]